MLQEHNFLKGKHDYYRQSALNAASLLPKVKILKRPNY